MEAKPTIPSRVPTKNRDPGPPQPCSACRQVDSHADDCPVTLGAFYRELLGEPE